MTDEPLDVEAWLAERPREKFSGLLSVSEVVGDYRVLGLIGRGGFAEVYGVEHVSLGCAAALKVLAKDTPDARERFLREARILAEVGHPGFPQFRCLGEVAGRPYFVTERLAECALPASGREVAAFLLSVLSALEALHCLGYVHRDVKPNNVLWRRGCEPVLVDLGLACPLETAAQIRARLSVVDGRPAGVGTPGYAAPEQLYGGEVSAAADVHAVGMLANECFGGHPPFLWRSVIRRATSSALAQRYPDAPSLARAIRRRGRPVLAAAYAAVVLSLAALGVGWWSGRPVSAFGRLATATSEERVAYMLEKAEEIYRKQVANPTTAWHAIPVVSFAKKDLNHTFEPTPELRRIYGPKADALFERLSREHAAGRCGKPVRSNCLLPPRTAY